MSHGRFEKWLIRAFTIMFLGRRNNLDTWKSNFEVETVFGHAVPLDGLVETDLQRCWVVVLTDDPGHCAICLLTQDVLVEH